MNIKWNAKKSGQVDVSVIIPTYNRRSLVVEAIDSALRQTAPPREIIVIDDGSTDDTASALQRFGDEIIFVRQENQGVGVARNRGLAMARGRYLAFLDSDDIWLDFKLELQVGVMERFPEIGFLFSDFLITREGMNPMPRGLKTWYRHPLRWEQVFENYVNSALTVFPGKREVLLYRGKIYRALLAEPYVLPSCALVRADRLTSNVRFAEAGPNCSDWEFFALLARMSDAGYLEIDTTINRGGSDRPRLTQTSAATKAELRLRMIGQVWKTDAQFLAAHGDEVTAIEGDQCIDLARARLLESKPDAALAALWRWLQLGSRRRWRAALVLAVCALLPASGTVLRFIRELRVRLQAVHHAFAGLKH